MYKLAGYMRIVFWLTVLMTPHVNALGNFAYCCEIQKCKNITSACTQSSHSINGSTCASACLSQDFSCYPAKTLPRNYTCFAPFLKASPHEFDIFSIICNQAYAPSLNAAPNFYINYSTCATDCGGWELSSGTKPTQWAGLLTQYILPSVVFCMTIPRWQKWDVPEWFFRVDRSIMSDNAPVVFKLLEVAALAVLDIICPTVRLAAFTYSCTFDLGRWIRSPSFNSKWLIQFDNRL
jgi:hypothetical protein